MSFDEMPFAKCPCIIQLPIILNRFQFQRSTSKKADRHLSKLHFLSKYLKPKVSTIADTTESVAQTSIDSNR